MWSALKSTIMKTLTCICALIYLAISQLDASQAQDKPFDEDSKITKPLRHVENWPQWRGPTADGHAGDHASPPIHWNKEKNIAWVAELPGEGSATPIVYGHQIFILSAIKTQRKSPTAVINDPRAKTTPDEMFYQFVVTSYDRSTGKVLWERVVTEQVPHEGKHDTNTYAAGSPTTDGVRLYFSFGSRGVFCYSLKGDLIWKIDLGDMRTRNGWGEAITPTLTDESLIINWDQEEGSFIAAVDKLTGELRWKVDRAGEVTSWNTPFVTNYQGKQQVIVNGTGAVKSYDAKDGTLLWQCGGQTVNAIPSPIRFGDSVICTSGYRGALACSIPLNSTGDVTNSPTIAWKVSQGTPYVPSPILSQSRLLFTAGNTNLLSCIDARNGKSLMDRMRLTGISTMYASPILANGHFYFTSREGTIVVVKDNESLDVVATNDLEDVIDASPVAVDNQLLVRSWNKLYCIEEMPETDSSSTDPVNSESLAGNLSFQQVDLEMSEETSANASLGDLDGDGDLDLVLAKGRHWPLRNPIFFNDSRGNFQAKDVGFEPDRSYAAALGDIDRDGDLDIVVSNDKPDEKKVYRNDGNGNFLLAGTWGDPTWNTRNVIVVDMNADQFPDLVVANRKSSSFIVFNDGKGNFTRENWRTIPTESATTIVAADFNGDGLTDLAIPHRDAGVSRILFNDPQMSFSNTATFGPKACSTRACAAGDINRDGAIDLILGDDQLGTKLFLNDGKGGFPKSIAIGDPKLVAYAIAVGDINQDHQDDLVVGYARGGSRVFINDGTGLRFQETSFGDGKGAVYGIALGDLDSDGRIDIAQGRSAATNTLFFNRGQADQPKSPQPEDTPWLSFPGKDGPGKGKKIVLIAAEQEYRSEQSMPMLAKILSQHHGFDCTVLFGVNASGQVDPTMPVYPEKGKEAQFQKHHIPGLEHLASADLVVFFTRLLTLPTTQLQQIVDYVDSGRPLIALRTANHGFRGPLPYKIDGKRVRWGEDVLGGTFLNHHGRWHADSTRGFFDPNHLQHPILIGVADIWGDSDVYRTYKEGTNLPEECSALVWGQPLMGRKPDDLPNEKLEPLPVAWVKPWKTSDGKTARVFHCTMGSGIDLKNPGLRRLLVNSAYWCTGIEESITANSSVEIVGEYDPLESGFNYQELGVEPRPISFYK